MSALQVIAAGILDSTGRIGRIVPEEPTIIHFTVNGLATVRTGVDTQTTIAYSPPHELGDFRIFQGE
jgi:hypothetical protein